MDLSPVLNQLFSTLWYLVPCFLCITLYQSAWFKGTMGEFIVNLLARFQLDPTVYHLLKNVTLATEDGSRHIDQIIVSVYGVFVVETKNIHGLIIGQPQQKMWTQHVSKYKSEFQNPLHQNHDHIKSLQALLYLTDEQVHSVIVFIGKSEFNTPQPENITHSMGYIRYIKSKTELLITPIERDQLIAAIKGGRLTSPVKSNSEQPSHEKQINVEKERLNLCPECGKEMLMRETTKGENKGHVFWACSEFPRCKGMVPIND